MGRGSITFSKLGNEKEFSQKLGNEKDGISKRGKRMEVNLENLEKYGPM